MYWCSDLNSKFRFHSTNFFFFVVFYSSFSHAFLLPSCSPSLCKALSRITHSTNYFSLSHVICAHLRGIWVRFRFRGNIIIFCRHDLHNVQ
jgi:hypothetical protein